MAPETGPLEAARFQAALLDAVGQAVVVVDLEGRITFWNPAAEAMYGWTAAEALGALVGELLVSEQSLAQGQEIMKALVAGESWHGDFVVMRRDGTSFPALVTDTPVFDERGELVAIIGLSTDISERTRAEETAQALSAIVESTADSILTKTLHGTILTWNRGSEELYGYLAEDAIGQHISFLEPSEATDEVRRILAAVAAGQTVRALETTRCRSDGTRIDVSLTVSPIHGRDGTVLAASEIGRDIGDRRRLEHELTRQAMHDTLTGLPNRTLLSDRLSHALAVSSRRGAPVAVLFLDLDNFKTVNDAHGHHAGDELLVEVGQRIRSVIRPGDTCARFGGDEFVIVCEDTDESEALLTADRVGNALADPIDISGQQLRVTASIGIAVSPPLDADPDTLLRFADAAMYDAKARGRARARVFDASLARQSTERLELTNELRDALSNDVLEVHYQPIVELQSGRLVGVEALTRWLHPVRGWIPPALFVPLAEESGLVLELDRWVLARACRDAAQLRACGALPASAHLSVNISARHVGDLDLLDQVHQAAADAGFPLDALELEVTETGLVADPRTARQVLAAIHALGVGIALDDFGTGYSSLTHLRQLPVTTIKIDRAFVQHVTDRPDDLAITVSILDLAHALGLRTVAEGVETPEQLSLLHQLGCVAGQGYLWSRALPRDALAALLRQQPDGFLAADPQAFDRDETSLKS